MEKRHIPNNDEQHQAVTMVNFLQNHEDLQGKSTLQPLTVTLSAAVITLALALLTMCICKRNPPPVKEVTPKAHGESQR